MRKKIAKIHLHIINAKQIVPNIGRAKRTFMNFKQIFSTFFS